MASIHSTIVVLCVNIIKILAKIQRDYSLAISQ